MISSSEDKPRVFSHILYARLSSQERG